MLLVEALLLVRGTIKSNFKNGTFMTYITKEIILCNKKQEDGTHYGNSPFSVSNRAPPNLTLFDFFNAVFMWQGILPHLGIGSVIIIIVINLVARNPIILRTASCRSIRIQIFRGLLMTLVMICICPVYFKSHFPY